MQMKFISRPTDLNQVLSMPEVSNRNEVSALS